jgi:molybdate/tungstate transport system substrate-binding protein
LAEAYLKLLLGPQGQAVLKQNGFCTIAPAYAVVAEAMPETLRSLVTAWPGS